jgi:hypothetical protein
MTEHRRYKEQAEISCRKLPPPMIEMILVLLLMVGCSVPHHASSYRAAISRRSTWAATSTTWTL